jgi:hypothetical protein
LEIKIKIFLKNYPKSQKIGQSGQSEQSRVKLHNHNYAIQHLLARNDADHQSVFCVVKEERKKGKTIDTTKMLIRFMIAHDCSTSLRY